MSPQDDSSGPLFVNALYEQEKIHEKQFSILAAPNAAFDAKLTYGGYQKANVEIPF